MPVDNLRQGYPYSNKTMFDIGKNEYKDMMSSKYSPDLARDQKELATSISDKFRKK